MIVLRFRWQINQRWHRSASSCKDRWWNDRSMHERRYAKFLKRNVDAAVRRDRWSIFFWLAKVWQIISIPAARTYSGYTTIIEKLDNFKHEWKSGSRATTRTVPVHQTVARTHLRSFPRSLFRNFPIAIRLSITKW